jgi:CheY-like chemotaxis protein
MPREVLERAFEPFFTTKAPGLGTGLGLAAVFGTVKQHHGTVVAKSAPGQGTEFSIYLPLATGIVVTAQPPRPLPGAGAARGRVLLVDDETLVREIAAEMLVATGYEVQACASARAGVAHYAEHWQAIDLVILDLVMPASSGPEVFARLREINPQARVLLCSGHSPDGTVQRLLSEGAVGFLQKPFGLDDLLRKVRAALA